MTFGKRLKYLREEKELVQRDVGEVINVSDRMIGYYESEEHFPRDAKTIVKLAEFFEVSLDYLFGISEVKDNKTIDILNSEFSTLSEDKQKDVIDYIKYLKTKS